MIFTVLANLYGRTEPEVSMISKELDTLLSTRGYPAVSILAPMHRAYPESRQNKVRLRNLLRTATARLVEEFEEEEVRPIATRLEGLIAEIDTQSCQEGIAVFVNAKWGTVVHLPLPVAERVVIDETFATRDLVLALHRRPRYRVLVLNERIARLYEDKGSGLSDVSRGRWPLILDADARDSSRPPRGDRGMDQTPAAVERRRHGLRAAHEELARLNVTDRLPLVVIGSKRALALFDEVSRGRAPAIATAAMTEDAPHPDGIAARIEPLIQEWTHSREAERTTALQNARWTGRALGGLQPVWTAARQGRIDSLLVEAGFRFPARVGPDGDRLIAAEDATAPDVIDDAVDELIEEALGRGARVTMVEDGVLGDYARVAAILRY